jgi:TPR repeat protein
MRSTNMARAMRAALPILALALSGAAVAEPLEDGPAVYNRQGYITAVRFWQPLLAEQGDANAQYNLGLRYDFGQGVPKNDALAVKWYRLAAEQGDADAQTNLGAMYANGEGVPKDDVLAYMWSNLAAAGGSEIGKKNRDLSASQMTPNRIAEAQRLSREWKRR